MTFYSILFKEPEDEKALKAEMPGFFTDLNLDQAVKKIVSGKEEYDLTPFFYTPLHSVDAILYRQEVMQDLEKEALYDHVESFAQGMRGMRSILSYAQQCSYQHQKERLFLDAVKTYCETVKLLARHVHADSPGSSGLLAFRAYLESYVRSGHFTMLLADTDALLADLSSIRYCVLIKDLSVEVRECHDEPDYSQEVEKIFDRFKQQAVKDYTVKFPGSPDMNHVEAAILDGVVQLYPGIFQQLGDFYQKNSGYQDERLVAFDREIQFYLAYLQYTGKLRQAGLPFCYPHISATSKEVSNYAGYDLPLAYKLVSEKMPVVTNDFYLTAQERIIVVTGPNQGGKTTFARTFGQLHYLACLGCLVPGREANLFLYDQMFTHFEKEENINTLHSKFEEDLVRIHDILAKATPNSIVIMNEILSSTALQDAMSLSERIMKKIIRLDALCIWVTFIDELIALSEKIVSMSSTVESDNPASRTFRIIRKPADGLAYALSIAEKYKVTYDHLKERIRS